MNKKTLSFFRICHQWIGLIGGWFLFLIFISGTISIFDKEITQWMQPELGQYPIAKTISSKALNQSFAGWEQYKHIHKNLIALPTDRDPYIRVLHFQDNMLQGVVIDPQEGNIFPVRATGGGYFIDSLHNNLFIGRYIGGAIVLIIGIAFLLVLISGVIIYFPNLIKNAFFVYHKPKTLRFKSDIHTITGLFFLPFLFIVCISGILFLAPRYMPNGAPPSISTPQKQTAIKQQPPELLPLLKKAEIHFHSMPSSIVFTKKEIKFFEGDQQHIARFKNYISFDKKTEQSIASSTKIAPLTLLNKTLLGIHTVRAGDILLRIVFAIMGLFSSILIAYGLLFYSQKKRNSQISTRSTLRLYVDKTIEGINIGIIMGSLIAITTLLWLNRLLSVSLIDRMHWEIRGFFITFFLIICCGIIASLWNKTKFIWISLTGILSSLCLLLPLLDYIQTGEYLNASINNHNYLYVTIDAIIFLFGVVFMRLSFYIQKKGKH